MKLIFATHNRHKVQEIQDLVPPLIKVVPLAEAGIHREIPEPHPTLQENAAEKARTIYALTGTACFGEDTGLEVDALNGEPGVHSARYAGSDGNSEQNVDKLLSNLVGQSNRKARFRTIICLVLDGKAWYFDGICEGSITQTRKGSKGFGYDPVFVPLGMNRTFAEMDRTEKNRFSHRAKAVSGLVAFLNKLNVNT